MGYGASLMVGIGLPIPILDEEMLKHAAVSDEEIFAPIVDYRSLSARFRGNYRAVSYAQLKSGEIEIGDKVVPAAHFPATMELCRLPLY